MKTLPEMTTPSSEQQIVCTHMVAGDNVVVDACAGSGKSTTILSVARALPTKRILQITYNAALRKEFQTKVQECGLKHVDVHTYHSLGVRYFAPDAHTDTGLRRILSDNVAPEGTVPKYDILVLDEAQDMTLLYFRFIHHFLRFVCPMGQRGRPHRIQLLVLGDWMQGLYEFKGADIRFLTLAPEVWSSCACLKSPTFHRCTLRMSYRITRPMAAFVNQVMIGGDAPPRLEACRDGVPVTYLRHCRHTLERIVVYHIQRILEEGDLPSDIFILGASVRGSSSKVRMMENALVERGIPCHVPMLENEKMDERVIQGKVVFSTFHSVKGRQRKYVFLMGFDQTYFTYYAKTLLDTKCPNTLYVGCTRATRQLFLLENNDHATDRPLTFLTRTHREMQELDYVDFKGQPQSVFYVSTAAADADTKSTTYLTPTDMIKFVPEHVLDAITPLLDRMFVCVCPGAETADPEKDLVPGVVFFPSSGLYEDVADLNGIALPCLFWDRFQDGEGTKLEAIKNESPLTNSLYQLIEQMLGDMKENEHIYLKQMFRTVDPADRSAANYLFLANLYVAVQEKLYFKLTQISRAEYGWLSVDAVEACMDRMRDRLHDSPMMAHEHVLVHAKMEAEHEPIDQVLRPFFADKKYRFSARLDLVTQKTVWEIKCTGTLSIEHRLQVIIYAWLWRLLPPNDVFADTPEKAFRLMNIKTGEVWELNATTDELTRIVVELLRGKYTTVAPISDEEFLRGTGGRGT